MAQRGKNFIGPELKQVCLSYLAISQDPCVGNGQKKDNFWERVGEHYKTHKPKGIAQQRSPKSLESKWGEIRHDTSKFIGCFQQIESLEISWTNYEDTLEKAKELYKQRHSKQKSFTFPECFEALKYIPRWATPVDAMNKQKGKTKSTPVRRESFNTSSRDDIKNQPPISPNQPFEGSTDQASENPGNGTSFQGKRPVGSKISKEIAKRAKLHKDSANISAEAQKVMAEIGQARLRLLEKQHTILEKQQFMSIFLLPLHNLDPEERDFMKMWKVEEMQKMKTLIWGEASSVDEEQQEQPNSASPSNWQVPPSPFQQTMARMRLPTPDAEGDTRFEEDWPMQPLICDEQTMN